MGNAIKPRITLTMHPLLERQIRKHLEPAGLGQETMRPFLEAVDRTYQHDDTALKLAEHSLDLMSQELTERNAALLDQLTERQRAEAQLENLLFLLGTTLESTVDGLLVLDREAKTVRFNRSFIEMWRVPDEVMAFWSHDTLMQHLLEQLVDAQAFTDQLAHLCSHPELECDDTFECSDGRVIERHSLPQPQGMDDVGRVLSFRDITTRRQAETALLQEKEEQKILIKKLEEAHNQLLQSEKMASVGQLAAGVAHEINNPIGYINSNLGTLRGYVERLLGVLDAYAAAETLLPVGEATQQIEAAKARADLAYLKTDIVDLLAETGDGIARVRRIVQDLKEFSHVDQGDWMLADLHKGLESTLNVVNNEIKYKARVVKEYGVLPMLHCLPSQLNQVFMNLLVNAAHAIEDQGVITLRTGTRVGEAGEEAWVEVADTGKGIPAHLLTRIFDPFFTTKPVGQGTGLGLSISYGIVQKHGGRIEVESEPGKGTAFRVVLPIQPPSSTHHE
ncbi:MAG: ATP-binding protein [Pseudomonadota bacterium]|nr:ATP-binding protein [Pseudomonadota bacterium]